MDLKHQIYLVKNFDKLLNYGYPGQYDKLRLYPVGGAEVKVFPKSTYSDTTVSAISDVFKNTMDSGLTTESYGGIQIEAEVRLNDKLRNGLDKLLVKPTLNITGAYSVSRSENWPTKKFEILDIPMCFEIIKKSVTKIEETASPGQPIDCSCKLMYSIILEWEKSPMKRKMVKVLDRLYQDRLLADCSIIPSNLNAVSCHRSVLSASSNVLHAMLTSGMEESQTNQIPMNHVSEEGVIALLTFIYEQEMKMDSLKTETTIELFKAAHEYNIPALEDEVVELLLKKSAAGFDLCLALDLYFFAVNVEGCDLLCKKMLQIFKGNPTQLRSSTAFKELCQTDHVKATDLLFKLLELENRE